MHACLTMEVASCVVIHSCVILTTQCVGGRKEGRYAFLIGIHRGVENWWLLCAACHVHLLPFYHIILMY